MPRSLKKGPFVDGYLLKAADKNRELERSSRPGAAALLSFQILLE